MRPVTLTKTLATAAGNNICLSQTPGGAGNLTLNGSLVSGGVATLDTARVVGITSAGNDSGRIFTVYGTDGEGKSVTESLAGPNITTVSTTANFATVTRIAIDGAAAGALTVGTTAVGSTVGVVLNQYISPFNISLFYKVAGSVTATVQYTSDDPFATGFQWDTASWTDHPSLTAKAVNTDSNIAYPATGVRMKVTTGTGTATLIVRQAGLIG